MHHDVLQTFTMVMVIEMAATSVASFVSAAVDNRQWALRLAQMSRFSLVGLWFGIAACAIVDP